MSLDAALAEFKKLEPEQVDEKVAGWLRGQIDYSTTAGKTEGNHRAQLVTLLRENKLWPRTERTDYRIIT